MFLYPVDVSEQILLNEYDSGADDYLYTTLSSANLLLKKLHQLSTRKNLTTKYEGSRMVPSFDTLTAVIDDAIVGFTPLEFKLLKLFTLNSHTVLTWQHILYFLWDRNGNYVKETSLNWIYIWNPKKSNTIPNYG
jgi:DNA-binding response OmpR family regulator